MAEVNILQETHHSPFWVKQSRIRLSYLVHIVPKIWQIGCWGLLMLLAIADICHNRRWCTLFQAGVIFSIHREREIFASFGYFVVDLHTFLPKFERRK